MTDKNSLDQILVQGLKAELKERVYSEILEELVTQFKNEIEPVLKDRFEKITIESVNHFRDLYKVTDEIQVLIKGVSNE